MFELAAAAPEAPHQGVGPSQPTCRLIDGERVAARMREQIRERATALSRLHGQRPALVTIRIGETFTSSLHVRAQIRACADAGIHCIEEVFPRDATQAEIVALIDHLNEDRRVSGILCQLPVPIHLDPIELINRIDPQKDVDGLTIANVGRLSAGASGVRPCTPLAVMLLLSAARVELRGAHAVVIGSSNLVGKPTTQLMLSAGAAVTQCHKDSRRLEQIARNADVLVTAVGQPEMVRGSWIKPGAVVVDVGVSRRRQHLVGDVCQSEALRVAGAFAPVPGGVGPIAIACLMSNTLRAANDQYSA
jgi:methylenetetrahydrofolate dehydrogenase (NADP+)/methenyltetrahydrofolate cyclohydrolase